MAVIVTLTGFGPSNWSYTLTDGTGPYSDTLSTIDYNGVHYYASLDPNPSPNHVSFFTIFRISFGPLTTADLNKPIGGGAPPFAANPPIPTPQTLSTPRNIPLAIQLAATSGTPAYTFAVTAGPSHGTVGAVVAGAFTYTPTTDYIGPDSITFTVTDTVWHAAISATITLTVTQDYVIETITPSHGPTAGGTPVTITGSGLFTGLSIAFGGVAATSVVGSTDGFSASCVTPPHSGGSVSVSFVAAGGEGASVNAFTYDPDINPASSPPFQTGGQWALHRFDVMPRREGPSGKNPSGS